MKPPIENWLVYFGVLYCDFYRGDASSSYVCKSQDFYWLRGPYAVRNPIQDGDYLKITDWHGKVFWESVVEWVILSDEERKLWEKYPGYLGFKVYPLGMSPLTWKEINGIYPQIVLYISPERVFK